MKLEVDFDGIRTEIINDMIYGKLDSAIKRLIDLSRLYKKETFYNVILISGDFHESNRLYLVGQIGEESYNVKRRKIGLRVLVIADEICENLSDL